MIELYLAGANCLQDINLFKEYGCLFMLETFYDMKKWDGSKIKNVLSIPCKIIIDSGAFTFMNSGQKVDWKQYVNEYIKFINKWDIKYFIELDLYGILGVEKTEKIRKRIEQKTGKKPIPVYHGTMPISYLRKLCSEYPYVAISATGTIAPSKWVKNKKLLKQVVKIAHSYGCKVHGLGYTRLSELNNPEIGFDSIDSTAWLSGARFGRVYTIKHGKIFYKDVRGIDSKREDLNRKNLTLWIKKQKELIKK